MYACTVDMQANIQINFKFKPIHICFGAKNSIFMSTKIEWPFKFNIAENAILTWKCNFNSTDQPKFSLYQLFISHNLSFKIVLASNLRIPCEHFIASKYALKMILTYKPIALLFALKLYFSITFLFLIHSSHSFPSVLCNVEYKTSADVYM